MAERSADRIQRKLPHYDQGKPRIRAFLQAGAEAVDELEDLFQALRDIWYVSTAMGTALDGLAARWGLTRYRDENDDRLRARIRREIQYCLQNATVEDLKACLELGLGWDANAVRISSNWSPTLLQEFPAYFEIQIPMSWLKKPEESWFKFSDSSDPTYQSDLGFNSGRFRPPVEKFLEYPYSAEELLERLAAAGIRFQFSGYGGFKFSLNPTESTFDSEFGFDRGKLVGIIRK